MSLFATATAVTAKVKAKRPEIQPLGIGVEQARFGDVFTKSDTVVLWLHADLRVGVWTGLRLSSPYREPVAIRSDWVADGWTFVGTIWVFA